MINRRQALGGVGTVGLGALLAACTGRDSTGPVTVPTSTGGTATVQPRSSSGAAALFDNAARCTLTPEQIEGPYYFDPDTIRRDIREDRAGTPLRLAVRVQSGTACLPVRDAVVDIWHCDAEGLYSGFETASRAGTGGPSAAPRTDQKRYLRGAQVTDAQGIVEFLTVYPGWYKGRAVHIHAKVHLGAAKVLTTQFYFDDAVSTRVFAAAPYSARPRRDTFNTNDAFINAGGPGPMLTLSADGAGYLALITIGTP